MKIIFTMLILLAPLIAQATPEEEIKLFYKKLNFVTLLSTSEERSKIEKRQGNTPLFAADPRLSIIEKYLDEISNVPLDSRSTAVRRKIASRWKNPALKDYMDFFYRVVSIEKKKDSYFVRLESIGVEDIPFKASLKGYTKNLPDVSKVDDILKAEGEWKSLIMENLDEWTRNVDTWQHWRVASSFKVEGHKIKIPE